MASPKVVTTNPDLPRQSSVCSLSSLLAEEDQQQQQEQPSKPISMDDLLNSIYSSSSSEPNPNPNPNSNSNSNSEPAVAVANHELMAGTKTMEEVWKEMVTGTAITAESQPQQHKDIITLEDFLTNTKPSFSSATDHDALTPPTPIINPPPPFIPNGTAVAVPLVGGGGRGKRRALAVQEAVVDKATLQKQRRMIKNRESAARSRERKQAYNVELESLVVQLEAENARLSTEEVERDKQRYKQLMECLVPVVEKPKPRRMLRRVNSVQW